MIIEWAILASAATVAKSVLRGVGDEYVNTLGERRISRLVGKVTEKLKTQTPAENHELAKAFRRACVKAAQHICDSRKTTQTGRSNLAPQHSLAGKILGETPMSLFAENESQWLDKANQYLKNQIERLDQNSDFLPEKDLSAYENLVNPKDIDDQIWANRFQRQLTKDMIAELSENAGQISASISFEFENRWFFQASNEFQKALGENQLLANKFQNNLLVKLDSGQQEIMRFLEMMFARFTFKPNDLPQLVGSLIERSFFVNRKIEKKNLHQWLDGESKKMIVIEGISGYGKTSLLMEVLHKLSPDGKTLDGNLGAVLIFLCRENEGTFRDICRKADEHLGKNENNFLKDYDDFLENTKDKSDEIPTEIINELIAKLKESGNVWLVFDNFETVLENRIISQPHLNAFFEKALQFDGLHFLLTSQKVPDFQIRTPIEEIAIGDLPDKDALEFFREEGKRLKDKKIDCGLAEIENADLEKLKNLGFEFVPMAMVTLVGYFEKTYPKEGLKLPAVLQDEQLFAKFREHDAREGSMYLIGLQYQNSSAVERLVLKTLPVFKQAIEYPIIVKILEGIADDDTIFAILMSNTLVRRIEPNFYELLPQAKEVILKQADREDEALTRRELHRRAAEFYDSIRQPNKDCYTREQFEPFFNAFDHFYSAGLYTEAANLFYEDFLKLCALGYMKELIARCQLLKEKLGGEKLEADNFINLGLALWKLGRLKEAVAEYDKAIAILEELVNEQKREEFANDLAKAYLNKGNALQNLGRLNEAVAEYDKTIAIYEELVNEQKREEFANDLAMAYMNKGVALYSLGRLNEAVAEYDKSIAIREELVNEQKREEFTNDLAKTYMNKGVALYSLGRLNEAVAEHDKSIEISEELVNEQKREEFANDLAKAYLNKGIALYSLGRLNEAVAEHDKSIAIYEKLVNEQKREELADNLAMAYMNKGTTLLELGKFKEAVAEYDKAIAIREELVNEQKRVELADNLAKTYWGKGMALVNLEKPEEAVKKYDEAIGIWYKCLKREETQILPNLFTVFYLKTDVLINSEHWKLTAENISGAFRLREKAFDEYKISQHFKDQIQKWWDEIIQLVRNFPSEKREEIYKHAGETGEAVRQMVEDGGDE